MIKVLNCVAYEHDLRLVALSAVICVLGCYTTMTLLGRARPVGGPTSRRWLALGAAVFGSSVWSLHFVAMLAFMPEQGAAFDITMTAISMVIPTLGVLVAFPIMRSQNPAWLRIPAGGIIVGLSITGMHYVGVDAMTSVALMTFDAGYVAASVAVSIVFSTVACIRAAGLATTIRRIEVAGWLSVAICGLHFTGMAAISIVPGTVTPTPGTVLGSATLAMAVGAVSVAILIASLAATTIDQHMSQRAVEDLTRMRLLSNVAREIIIIQADGIVLEINSAGERLRKEPAADIVGRPLVDLFAKESIPALERRGRCPPAERRAEEMHFQAADGTTVGVELNCQPMDYMGRPATVIALRDLTSSRRDEARIRHIAKHDTLTALPNRYNVMERLEIAIDAAKHGAGPVALVYIDLDRFKQVNDLHGHAAGDALLIQAGRRMLREMDPADMLARLGGDEFVMVITSDAGAETLAAMARRVVETLRQPFQIDRNRIAIGASVGVAIYPTDGTDVDALMRAADVAMYRVKKQGRGAVRFYEASMDEKVQARLALEQEMVGATERGEFELHYQPIANARTGDVEAFEALIRWNHPTHGMVHPNEFIPLAEETGLVDTIGRWVIEAACREAAAWRSARRVSVNVSPAQFRHGHVCEVVRGALERYRLDPGRLCIEVTEGVLIEDTQTAIATLNELRAMGVRIALDDFGTGYSSLSYLKLFRFDRLKIDQSFVSELGHNEESLTLTRTIINLGHNLGLRVTAEGVETETQMAVLRKLGCDQMQGYLIGRPAPMATFERQVPTASEMVERRDGIAA